MDCKGLTENVVSELGILEAESLELVLGFGAQHVRARGPEAGDGGAHRGVVGARVGVDVAGVGDFALCRRVDAVNLGAGQRLERRDAELFGEGIYARVLEELVARVVDGGQAGVGLECALAGELPGEVFARVEVFEEAADGVVVFVGELDLARLQRVSASHGGRALQVARLTLPSSTKPWQAESKKGLLVRRA